MISIPLRGGQIALIDDCDLDLISPYAWYLDKHGYAFRNKYASGKATHISMHRMILPTDKPLCVDHINGNPLDNRRSNLRIVTHAQNLQNRRGATRQSSSGVRNVYFHPLKRKYQVKLQVDGHQISCGYFWTLEEATVAAAAARRKHMTHAPECERQ